MAERGGHHAPSIPVPYRITLALSLAFMVHIFLLAGLPSPLQEARELSQRLVFKLSSPSALPAADSAPATKSRPEARNPEFNVKPWPPQVVTTAPQATARPKSPERNEQPRQRPAEEPQQRPEAAPSPAAAASSRSTQSAPSPSLDEKVAEQIQRITESPAEQDPYLIKLAVHLAETLEQLRVPAMSELRETVVMTLELRILDNGALTRARIQESTGIDRIDQAAYRAALAASPYPRPEGEKSDRFEVKLVFTPKRQ